MIYDVIVIGGGPAGLMAAGRAGELGARVLLLEKNNRLGIKLLMTGKGRCNLTNELTDIHEQVKRYRTGGAFLYSAFSRFNNRAVIDFFESRGLPTKVEDRGRVFPVSDKGTDVLEVIQKYLASGRVEIKTEAQVKKIIKRGEQIEKIVLLDGQELTAKHYILATGGLSYPETGSTGDGFRWLKDLGHTVVTPRPALTPIELKDKLVSELEGLSLRAVKISVFLDDKKRAEQIGDVVFTADGLSGPLALDLSRQIGELLPSEVVLKIDFLPTLTEEALDEKLQILFKDNSNKQIQNSLTELVAPKLLPSFLRLSGVMAEKKNNEITKVERRRLIFTFKVFKLTVKRLKGFDRATITAGGVTLREIDPKTMRSKSINNLSVVGEVLDVDGPTGGFNLQEAFSTGFVAGDAVGASLVG